MVGALGLIRRNREARLLIGARGLSAIGTGAAYVALMLVAYDRTHSAWVVSAVLGADLLPSMLGGSLAGALADRVPRRRLIIGSELAGCAAFIGMTITESTVPLVLFALVAGAATTVGMTALMAYLADLFTDPDELLAANGSYAAVSEGGTTVGMAVAAGALLFTSPAALLGANAVTFLLAALLIARTHPTVVHRDPETHEPVLRAVRDGARLCWRLPQIRRVLTAGFAANTFLALINVGEVVLARGALNGGASAYSLLVTAFGLGLVVGSLAAPCAFPRNPEVGFRSGLFLASLGLGCSAASPNVAAAIGSFAVSGVAGGFVMVYGRKLVHDLAPADALGRVFGVRDQLGALAFGAAFMAAPALIGAVGVRGLFLVSAAGALVVGGWLFVTAARPLESERSTTALRTVVVDSGPVPSAD